MTVVVVSQPMFLPWIGLFDQMRLADVFVHYDDVLLPQGRGFNSRVQLATPEGTRWLTAPIDRAASGKAINQTRLQADDDWRRKHLEGLRHAYARTPNFEAMFDLAGEVYATPTTNLAEFNMTALECVADRIGLRPNWACSSALDIPGSGTQRLVDLSAHFNADTYLTGHGAANYMDHDAFEARGIDVAYMNYGARPWPQIMPEFTPYVTIFDLLASVPFDEAAGHMTSAMTPWRDFQTLKERTS